ncbi:sensor histidine kinase [Labilibaculum euxinus]
MDTQEKSKSDFIKELHKLQQEFNSLTILYDKNIAEQKLAKQELLLANKELVYQNELKEKRAAELIVANKELAYQNKLKEKRAVELVNAKNKAEASDHLKTAFMNNISHEIRTPLNGILGFAPLIIQSDITMEEKEEFLEILNSSSDRLLNTINAIMDISLIISGNMEVHPQPINISSLLTNTYHNFQESCMKKNLAVKMQFPDNVDNFILNTDGELLQKAVSKLVSNAVKFTTKGSITLGFELINNEIEIFVKDTGTGIEKDSQKIIYKSFMQENISDTRGHEGSGLGLSISKGIIQLLGGKIRLESKKDIGTTVFFIHSKHCTSSFFKTKEDKKTNQRKKNIIHINR